MVDKCHPNLLEEKLKEHSLKGWKYINLLIEQANIEKKIHDFQQPVITTLYVLIFEKLCQD
jgi:hypothetical protein